MYGLKLRLNEPDGVNAIVQCHSIPKLGLSCIGGPVKSVKRHLYSVFYKLAFTRLSWDKGSRHWVKPEVDG